MWDKLMQNPSLRKASNWFYGLSDRDQMALKLMVAAIVLVLLYLAVWLPSSRYLESARSDLERQRSLMGWIKTQEATARVLAAQGNSNPGGGLDGQSMLSTIGSSAKNYSIELKRFEPEGENKMRIWLEKVPFNQMILWLDDLQKRFGIQVDQISVDRDDTPGVINARLSLATS